MFWYGAADEVQTWRERTSINNALKFASSSDPVLDHLRYCLQHADYLSHLWFELLRLPTLNLILSTHQFLKNTLVYSNGKAVRFLTNAVEKPKRPGATISEYEK